MGTTKAEAAEGDNNKLVPVPVTVTVYTETNLGTRLVTSVSPLITAGFFKRKLEQAHVNCFPEFGVLSVTAVMVKVKSIVYHLPDSIPLKYACQSFKNEWFISVDCLVPRKRENGTSLVIGCTKVNRRFKILKYWKKKLSWTWNLKVDRWRLMAAANAFEKKNRVSRKQHLIDAPARDCSGRCGKGVLLKGEGSNDMEVFRHEQQSSITIDELPSGSLSSAKSVSGIIGRYFSNFTDLDEICSPLNLELSSEGEKKLVNRNRDAENSCPASRCSEQVSLCRTTHKLLHSPFSEGLNTARSRNVYDRSEVGARLLTAADGLRPCQINQESPVSKLYTGLKFLRPDVDSIAQNLVYEIGC